MHEASGGFDEFLIFNKAMEQHLRNTARTDQGRVRGADDIEEDIPPLARDLV